MFTLPVGRSYDAYRRFKKKDQAIRFALQFIVDEPWSIIEASTIDRKVIDGIAEEFEQWSRT